MRRVRQGGLVVGLSAGVLVAAALPVAVSAQPRLPSSDEAEAPLPDVDAIERGARPPASLSFRKPNASTEPEPGDEIPAPRETVRRLRVAAPPILGGQTGIYGLETGLPGEANAPSRRELPESHVVGKGETLSSLCQHYFSNPWCWPKLWSENPQVTNPHWIFPGDVLRLRAGSGTGAEPSGPVAGARGGVQVTGGRRGSLDSKSLMVREAGFIDPDALAESARLSGSREEKIMLASGDQAYVTFEKNKPLRAGERYSVFVADTKNPVRSPETGAVLGYMVRVYGDIVVDQISERNMARGTLFDLVEPVERGFAVSRKVRLFKTIEPRAATGNMEARIVASFSPAILLAAENFVVLSRGLKDGLAIGNRVFVVRRGDGYRPIMEGWARPDLRYPKEVVAELWVMDVRDTASVAWVVRSTKELRVGEVAELRKGH